jgi:VCBS repeat-containing protein
VTLGSAFTSGATITATATAYLTMNGSSHPVTITISGRRDGSALQAAGSIPITLSIVHVGHSAGGGEVAR